MSEKLLYSLVECNALKLDFSVVQCILSLRLLSDSDDANCASFSMVGKTNSLSKELVEQQI